MTPSSSPRRRLNLDRAAARRRGGEHFLSELPGSPRGPLRPLELLLAAPVERLAAQLLQAAEHHGQQVVEVVHQGGDDTVSVISPGRPRGSVAALGLNDQDLPRPGRP